MCVFACTSLLEPLDAFKTLLKILQGCRNTQWTVWKKKRKKEEGRLYVYVEVYGVFERLACWSSRKLSEVGDRQPEHQTESLKRLSQEKQTKTTKTKKTREMGGDDDDDEFLGGDKREQVCCFYLFSSERLR